MVGPFPNELLAERNTQADELFAWRCQRVGAMLRLAERKSSGVSPARRFDIDTTIQRATRRT